MNNKKEKIVLTQIKQDFTTPVDAISDYINLIIDSSDIYDEEISSEFENIKKSAKTLRINFNEAFLEFAETKRKTINNDEEASILRHDLRTPLNGIIGYSEILIEDYEDDIDEKHNEDLSHIIELAKEIEAAISRFVDFLKEGASSLENANDGNESADNLFSSLGKIKYKLEIIDEIKNAKILVVDDIKTNCDVLKRRLESNEFYVDISMSGKEALEKINQQKYDLMLLDVLMPEVNGLEVLIKAREQYSADKLPIIMVSSFDDVESISKCIQLGASDYLSKPVNSTILTQKVASTLERKALREREEQLLSELHRQAITDEMTGIPNRRYVFDILEKSFSEIEKESKEHFATAIFDIDHFKNVNDTYGHAAGDEIIRKVSTIATSVISSPDIFGRIGGEEFLAVIFNNSKEHLQQICEKVRSTIENSETLFDNQKIRVTISGGVCFTHESTSVSDMVNKADERLYLAKKNGRNKFYLNEGE
ncbi:MAG: diguanylate cyclase [Gammaproteobacteria bacterium TMED112]|nr:MAG: diguanylate cyclase [Gammaproteobacteria bacterium TMED112]|tara:strand:+ start:7182 stop:8624 length:1443 start_codon:yes stop_codon:yes gene_type:complete